MHTGSVDARTCLIGGTTYTYNIAESLPATASFTCLWPNTLETECSQPHTTENETNSLGLGSIGNAKCFRGFCGLVTKWSLYSQYVHGGEDMAVSSGLSLLLDADDVRTRKCSGDSCTSEMGLQDKFDHFRAVTHKVCKTEWIIMYKHNNFNKSRYLGQFCATL